MVIALLAPTASFGNHQTRWQNKAVETIEQETDTEKRLKLINAYISAHPNEVDAYGLRCLSDNIKAQFTQAVADATLYLNKKDLNKIPADFDTRVLKVRAHGLFALEKFDLALKDLTRYEHLMPSDQEGYFIEGAVRRHLGQNALAIKAFKKSCTLGESRACGELIKIACAENDTATLKTEVSDYLKSHKSLEILREKTSELVEAKKFAQAIVLYRAITEALPTDDDDIFRQDLISVLFRQNKDKEAFAEIDKTKASDEVKEKQKLAFLFQRQDVLKTLAAAQAAAKKFPDCVTFVVYQGDCYIRQRQYQEALNVLNGQPKFAGKPELAPLKAEAYYNLQEFQLAADNFAITNKISPTAYALEEEGTSLALLQKYAPSVICFTKALKMKPTDVHVYGQRADAQLHLKNWDAAMTDLNTVLKLDSEKGKQEAVNYYGRGLCYAGKGNYAKAVKDFSFVIQHDQNLVRHALVSRSECLEKLGDAEGARRDKLRAAEFDKKLEKDLF